MGRLRVLILLFAIIAVMVAAGACSRHDDKPPMLGVQQPPNPQNVTVTTPDQGVTFMITWDVNNPALVAYYNIYTQDPFTGQATFTDSTTTTTVQVTTGGIPVPGLVFGVASVTTENVESQIIFASADP